jgi:hypothetical protein
MLSYFSLYSKYYFNIHVAITFGDLNNDIYVKKV